MSGKRASRRGGSPAPNEDAGRFATALKKWFRKEGRDYPWRRTTEPYAILVSEIMLQQTRIATVLERGFYDRWMKAYPDVATLAAAPEEEVLRAWEGLGYYRRARNLQAAAQQIVSEHGGQFPEEREDILELRGVGRYTAGAVASFAFGRAEAIVDGNVSRVLARLFDLHDPIDSGPGQKQIWAWAEELVPARDARAYNSGLMELGQRICLPAQPQCEECPVARWCQSSEPEQLPMKKARPRLTDREEHVVFQHRGGRVLLEKEAGSRRTGFWKLPTAGNSDAWIDWPVLFESRYTITRYRVQLVVHDPPANWEASEGSESRWISRAELKERPMATPHRKALERLLSEEVP